MTALPGQELAPRGHGGASASSRRPRGPGIDGVTALTLYLVLLLGVPAPMVIEALGQIGGPSTLLAGAFFIWWCWHLVSRTEALPGKVPAVRGAVMLLLGTVVLVYGHSAGLSLPGDERAPADGMLVRLVGMTGVICVAVDGIGSWERLWTLARRWSLALGALSVLVFLQILTGEVWVDRLSLPGLSAPMGLELIQRGQLIRPSGTSTHPIELASLLAMSMPLVVAVAVRETRHPRLLWAVALVVPAMILLSGSRTALVCGGVAFVVMLAGWGTRARLIGTGAGFLLLVVAFVAMPGFIGTLRGLFVGASADPSVASRTNSWGVAFEHWANYPWLGRGLGTFLPRYWIFDNQYLNLLVSGGAAVVLALLGLVVVALVGAARATRRTQGHERQLVFALAGGTAAGAVSLALFDGFAFPQAMGAFFLVIGLCGVADRLSGVAPDPAPDPPLDPARDEE